MYVWNRAEWTTQGGQGEHLCFGLGHGHGNGLDLQAVLRHDPICVCPRQVTDVVSGCASCSCPGWLGARSHILYIT